MATSLGCCVRHRAQAEAVALPADPATKRGLREGLCYPTAVSTSTITGTIKDASGTALSGVTVLAKLRPFGFATSGAVELASQMQTTTNGSGIYTFTLERNADILPTGTWYEIEEQIPAANGGRQVWAITVATASTSVYACLITTPPDAGTASQYLTQAAGDARYVPTGSAGITQTAADARYPLLSYLTTQGDLPYASAAGTWARLPKGTAMQRLRMNSAATAPEWAAILASISITTSETTTSATYVDLATAGPAVTLNTGTQVVVLLSTFSKTSSAGSSARMGVAVSGASTVSASDSFAILNDNASQVSISRIFVITGLTAGSNTFTAKYSTQGGATGTFANRDITVIPF